MIEIVSFQPKYSQDFFDINEAWISTYFKMEAEDYKYLKEPQEHIIDKGGFILIALLDGHVVGTCALIKTKTQKFELGKMGVTPAAQGKKIGWLLGQAAIEKAKSLGAKSLFLESNRKLIPAISLYRKLGFIEINQKNSVYERCDILMELIF